MSPIDSQGDPVLALLRELHHYDVDRNRARRLRTRCHRLLEASNHSGRLSRSEAGVWPRAVRVLAGTWCVLYLWETLRQAAQVYGF